MNVYNFRLISVLKLVVTIVEVDGFHKKVKRTWCFLNWMKICHWWLFTLHLIWIFTVDLIWVFTVHLVRMIFRRNIINVWEMIFFNWRLGMIVITRVVRVLRKIAIIFPHFTTIWKLTINRIHVKSIGSRLNWLLRFWHCRSLDFRRSICRFRNGSNLPLILWPA